MEFPGVGTIPYEAPSENLKHFFRKKYKAIFRFASGMFGGGDITKERIVEIARKVSTNFPGDDQEKQKAYKHEYDTVCGIFLFGKDSIYEEEFVEKWIETVFNGGEKRKNHMEFIKSAIKYSFKTVDTDRNGVIDFKEFETWYQIRCGNHDTIKKVFDGIDVNGDGVISEMEWGYAISDYYFNSGPENTNSLFYGSPPDN